MFDENAVLNSDNVGHDPGGRQSGARVTAVHNDIIVLGYFRAMMAQENLIKASSIPYTIVRATQFFEFVSGIAQSATEGQTVRLPAAMMQPIASDDVAVALVDVALAEHYLGDA